MRYYSEENRLDYAPPMLGNGAISIALDYTGAQSYDVSAHGPQCKIVTEGRAVWWAGRRLGYPATRPLIPFGYLTHTFTLDGRALAEPEKWEQALDVRQALMNSVCRYSGATVWTEAFVHARYNVIAIEKEWRTDAPAGYDLCYRLGAASGSRKLPGNFLVEQKLEAQGVCLRYQADGQRVYRGVIRLMCDVPCRASIGENAYTLHIEPVPGRPVHFYLIFSDEDEPGPGADELSERVLRDGYAALRKDHVEDWARYHAQGRVSLPDSTLERVYLTAQYALRISTTQWSIPPCLNDCCWDARFFAFDEFFNFHGLLTSGHTDLARRVTDFRFGGLSSAVSRASSRGMSQAHYPWETVETHEEAAPPGFYYDHIFHMANVALGQWYYALYTGDRDYLRDKGYPVMRACAEFYARHMLYRVEGGKLIVGRCTDLERLGASVLNPFMTTCGVIVTLRNTAQAAARLGVDESLAREYTQMAQELLEALPQNGRRYLPAPNCEQRSIGVFAGCYPYPIFHGVNDLLLEAIRDYTDHEQSFGNMYTMGRGVSSWYAAWKAAVYARLSDADACVPALRQAAASTGCFGEFYEINEPGAVQYRPWFTTSAGTFLTAVNEALVQCEENAVLIAQGIPSAWQSFAFELPAWQGRYVRVRVENGRVTKCAVDGPGPVELRFPPWLDCSGLVGEGWVAQAENHFTRMGERA